MDRQPLDNDDFELIDIALKEFQKKLSRDWHGVAAAVRLKSGKIFTSLVLEAEVPALTICAEPTVISKALDDIEGDPVTHIVAVRNRDPGAYKVIPPCGRCREFITDYCAEAFVIVKDDENELPFKVLATDLLPFKYKAMP